MCGIAGLFEYAGLELASEQILQKMTLSLKHRGPDAEGLYISGPVGLGHRRLAILDVSKRGNQPMKILNEQIVVTYNGELYNFHQLRSQLEGLGHRFFSTCDTEVVVRAYHEWGVNCVDRFSGIFALGIWDARSQSLFLARDPLGVKPLFYNIDDRTFRFGSEIKAILSDKRIECGFCDEGLDAYFTFGYSAAPCTGLRSVRQLLPGHYAKIGSGGIELVQYWQVPYQDHQNRKPLQEMLGEYQGIFDRVVRRQLVSDVPIGVFISGGLDSSAVASSISRIDRRDVTGFSVGFTKSSFNELPFARQVADALGMKLVEDVLDINAVELICEISRFIEEPTADSSMIAFYLLCKMASEHVKVALSGDGADEILAGYDTYRANRIARNYRKIPLWVRNFLIKPMVRRIPISDHKYNLHQFANRFIEGSEAGPGRDHCSWRIMFSDALKSRLYSEEFRRCSLRFDSVGRYAAALKGPPEGFGRLAETLHADTTFYLPNDMLVKVDRMSMAHGLEVRVPFLDTEMVAFCMNLPPDIKLHKGKTSKYILRQQLRDQLPNTIVERRKSGFNVPIESWIRQPKMKELLFDLIRQNSNAVSDYLRIDTVEDMWIDHAERRADYGHALFTILMFALWCANIKAIGEKN
jgi:asparagine synthase (glutamine-hydrolysing)